MQGYQVVKVTTNSRKSEGSAQLKQKLLTEPNYESIQPTLLNHSLFHLGPFRYFPPSGSE